MIDRSDETDLIPTADELREEVIDKSILVKQTKGWKVIRTRLIKANESGIHTITLNNTGGGQAHDNMPPYLVVYMWKRTA